MNVNDLIQARHPIYIEDCPMWIYYRDHYEGGPQYCFRQNPLLPGGAVNRPGARGGSLYLWQHALETSDAFAHRLARSAYVNIVAPVVDLYAATVGKQEYAMIEAPDLIEFLDDVTRQGDSLRQFLEACRINAAVRGHTFILVDAPAASGPLTTQADAVRQGIRPYLVEILAEDMLNWRLGEDGQPQEILFRTAVDPQASLLEDPQQSTQVEYRYWSKTEWLRIVRVDKNYEVVARGPNPLGVVPLAVLYHKRRQPFRGVSLIKDSARIAQLLTNWVSGLDQAMEMQMFAVPVLHSRKAPAEVGVGISVCLHLNPDDGEEFKYVAPDVAPFEAGWQAFYRMIQLANRQMGIKSSPITDEAIQAQSGISKAWDFFEAEKIMAGMALNEQEAVKMILSLAHAWYGTEENFTVQYSTKFDLTTLADDIANMLQLQAAAAPVTVRRELMRRIVAKALPSMSTETYHKLQSELDAYGEPPAPSFPLPPEA